MHSARAEDAEGNLYKYTTRAAKELPYETRIAVEGQLVQSAAEFGKYPDKYEGRLSHQRTWQGHSGGR